MPWLRVAADFREAPRGAGFAALPAEARAYVEFIETQLGHRINMVSNGPEREAIIIR